MNKLKTLGKTSWKKIKVGEVFALKCCWIIFAKIDSDNARLLSQDYSSYWGLDWWADIFNAGSITGLNPCDGKDQDWNTDEEVINHLYKLPKSVQKLWLQE